MEESTMSNQKWDTKLYDKKHGFVSKYGNELLDLLSPVEDENILDIGCGTGDLANEILISGAKVTGVDASEDMIRSANDKYPSINFYVMDANNLEFKTKFDAVFSNAVLHWIKSPKKVLESVFSVLDSDGRFVCEFGGKGNCETILNSVINNMKEMNYDYDKDKFPWYFPSIGEYTSLMEEVGFRVTYARHFDRPTKLMDDELGLRNWISMFVGNLVKEVKEDDLTMLIDRVESEVKHNLFVDGNWYADYKRIRVIGIKK